MMEYARLYFDFLNSEKAQNLIDECGDAGVVSLIRLWVRAGQRNTDGIFKKNGRAIEKIAQWKGEPGKLIATLTDSDFILLDVLPEGGFQLHNWEKNNPHLSDNAKKIRTERARKAGLASAEKKRQESTTSQLQVNSESTTSQLNSTKGQLDSTKVTKHKVTKHNKKKKSNKKEKNGLIDSVIEKWNEISGQSIHLTTKIYRDQISGRIDELKKQGIKDEDIILSKFEYVFTNQKALRDAGRFDYWNLKTLTRPSNFMPYLNAPDHSPKKLPEGLL